MAGKEMRLSKPDLRVHGSQAGGFHVWLRLSTSNQHKPTASDTHGATAVDQSACLMRQFGRTKSSP